MTHGQKAAVEVHFPRVLFRARLLQLGERVADHGPIRSAPRALQHQLRVEAAGRVAEFLQQLPLIQFFAATDPVLFQQSDKRNYYLFYLFIYLYYYHYYLLIIFIYYVY